MGRKGPSRLKKLHDQTLAAMLQGVEKVRATAPCTNPRHEVSAQEVNAVRAVIADMKAGLRRLTDLQGGQAPGSRSDTIESLLSAIATAGQALGAAAAQCASSAGPTLRMEALRSASAVVEAAQMVMKQTCIPNPNPGSIRHVKGLAMSTCDAALQTPWTNRAAILHTWTLVRTWYGMLRFLGALPL